MEKIKGIACDSREVNEGYAFVAIKGTKSDGNDYIKDAINRGVSIVYSEKPNTDYYNIPYVLVENARLTLSQLAAKFYSNCFEKLNIIGVTGTNGKTTTTQLIHGIFNSCGQKTGLIGTVKVDTGKEIYTADLTTPDPMVLHSYFKEMVDFNCGYCAMEVSSHGIKMDRINGIPFEVGIFTNITEDHSDFHPDFNDYVKTKAKFFTQIKPEGLAIVNSDDKHHKDMLQCINSPYLTYGFNTRADITASTINLGTGGSNFNLCIQREFITKDGLKKIEPMEFLIKTRLLGNHNIYNLLAAVATSLWFNIEVSDIQKAIYNFEPFWRRLQPIYNEGFTVIDDCAHNPGNFQAVFESIQNMNFKNLYIIVAVRGSRGEDINRKNGRMVGYWSNILNVKKIIITDCDGLSKPGDAVHESERKAFIEGLTETKLNWEYINTLKFSIDSVLDQLSGDDLLLLLGAHPMDSCSEVFFEVYSNKLDKNLDKKNISREDVYRNYKDEPRIF
jgi:UDP-N-acetylmuramoyl-L-alanyl-D-glutamate--2,6-diaminopimelate ligase